jgi:hypothetical protein
MTAARRKGPVLPPRPPRPVRAPRPDDPQPKRPVPGPSPAARRGVGVSADAVTIAAPAATVSLAPETAAFLRQQRIIAILTYAGQVARRRARQGSSPGWRRPRTVEEVRAFEECAHGTIAHLCGLWVNEVSIVPNPRITVGRTMIRGGVCSISSAPPDGPQNPTAADAGHTVNDFTRIARCAGILALAEPPERFNWRRVLRICRGLRRDAETLVIWSWPIIVSFSDELVRLGVMDQQQVAMHLRPEWRGRALQYL